MPQSILCSSGSHVSMHRHVTSSLPSAHWIHPYGEQSVLPHTTLSIALQALTYAKDRGALCIGITNTVGSAIARTTHCGVHINAGCEIGVASTKAYTSQMVAITMMALALSEDSIAKRPKRDAIIDALGALPDALRKVGNVLWPLSALPSCP